MKTWRRFPSPLGESILITRNEVSYEAAVALFPSPLGESILITNLTPHEITFIDDEGFRPLSGIQFSLRNSSGLDDKPANPFPSPLGDSILITQNKLLSKTTVGIRLFPSPLGDSILITHSRFPRPYTLLLVSVPSRGFNSHYIRRPLKRRRPALFPSPLGDSILITLWRRHCPATRRRSFRPLSGIQFSLRSHKYVMDDPVDGGGFRPLSGIQFSLQITAARKTWDLSQFPSPLGDSILITSKMSKLRPAG